MTAGVVHGWVLYDGECGFCGRWVPRWAPFLGRLGLDVAPLQSPWVRTRLGYSDEELLQEIALLFRDGRVIRGADVYRFILGQRWYLSPLYLLTRAPVLRLVFDAAYRAFARHRYAVSRACNLKPR